MSTTPNGTRHADAAPAIRAVDSDIKDPPARTAHESVHVHAPALDLARRIGLLELAKHAELSAALEG
jgi:hypothetical protein